jgi:hypothetical protein
MNIDSIPVDVLSRVLRFLPLEELPNVSTVNSVFLEAFDSELLWKDLYYRDLVTEGAELPLSEPAGFSWKEHYKLNCTWDEILVCVCVMS